MKSIGIQEKVLNGIENPVSLQLFSSAVYDSRRSISLLSDVPVEESCILGDRSWVSNDFSDTL